MSHSWYRSIARLVARYGAEQPRQGTAFLISGSGRYLLTCRHCAPSPDWNLEATFNQVENKPSVKCRPIWYHSYYDIAVLEADNGISIDGLPMNTTAQHNAAWDTFGYPSGDSTGRPVDGVVASSTHLIGGHPFISLRVGQDTDEMRGISGSP